MDESQGSARRHHERQWESVLWELMTGPIGRIEWERKNLGCRLAPAIDVLRNRYGYDIGGDGSYECPYYLKQREPIAVEVTDEMYDAYLSTDHWKAVRDHRLNFDGVRCVQCRGHDDLQVHHWEYRWFKESVMDVCTYCRECHEMIHQHGAKGRPKSAHPEIVRRIALESRL